MNQLIDQTQQSPIEQIHGPATASTGQILKSEERKQKIRKDPRPELELPGNNRLACDYARDLGVIMRPQDIFTKDDSVCRILKGQITPVDPQWFRTYVEKFCITKAEAPAGLVVRTMSREHALLALQSDQFKSQLRPLQRVNPVCMPVSRANGKVELLQAGYDAEKETFTLSCTDYDQSMPFEDAATYLRDCLKGFPFADDGRSLAVILSAMLTVYASSLLPSKAITPAFLIQGNRPGLGKGLLAMHAIIPVLGFVPTGAQPKNEEEIRKFLFAAALDAHPVVFFDNVAFHIASPSLESYITTSTITGRKLRTSTTVHATKQSTVFITGNGCTMSKDMERRTLICALFSEVPSEQRSFDKPIDEGTILQNRTQILAALLSLVRDWVTKNRPKGSQINKSFPAWSEVIGGIVENAGFKSPCLPYTAPAQEDPDAIDMEALTAALFTKHASASLTFKEVISVARENGLFDTRLELRNGSSRRERTEMGRVFAKLNGSVSRNGIQFIATGAGHARRFTVAKKSTFAGQSDQPTA